MSVDCNDIIILPIFHIIIISHRYLGINAQQCSDTDYVRAIYEASDLVWARYHDAYADDGVDKFSR